MTACPSCTAVGVKPRPSEARLVLLIIYPKSRRGAGLGGTHCNLSTQGLRQENHEFLDSLSCIASLYLQKPKREKERDEKKGHPQDCPVPQRLQSLGIFGCSKHTGAQDPMCKRGARWGQEDTRSAHEIAEDSTLAFRPHSPSSGQGQSPWLPSLGLTDYKRLNQNPRPRVQRSSAAEPPDRVWTWSTYWGSSVGCSAHSLCDLR